MKLLCVTVVIFCQLSFAQAVLQAYIPAINGQGNMERDELIESYFNLGFQQLEIVAYLALTHGITISLRQLKRILRRKGLRRRTGQTDLSQIIRAIEQEMKGSGIVIGYRAMWQRLRNDHRMVVSRETVRHALRILDPEGVSQRLRHRLRRRQYRAKGPNFLWHIDGYDKLKPFGFCVHGCIDGFSRRIMWLEVSTTNNDPRVVAQYFLSCVRQTGGTPSILRADYGTENVKVAGIQRFFRRDSSDSFAMSKSFMFGKSVSNQRIEAWWGQLRKNCSDWWINHFKDMRDNGLYCDGNIIHQECLKFCYMPVLRQELQRVAMNWNIHRIRPSSNPDSPPGRPDTLYFLPSLEDTHNCKHVVEDDDIDIAEQHCGSDPPPDCVPSFSQLALILMGELGLDLPDSGETANALYIKLIAAVQNI